MAEHLFKDKFKVSRVDPDGKKFDKGYSNRSSQRE
ncbi:hypothetical protein ZEAMMB73_Zm00001d036514 [Zea mays]|uniref:Uncharacterized protein n=3 Tax=Zea mays TaxID=4577 RepID=A0A1D6LP08_MAIZE|nr:hypothetical protein ZEAMMB73_Zm00001d036514 [Zea mays]